MTPVKDPWGCNQYMDFITVVAKLNTQRRKVVNKYKIGLQEMEQLQLSFNQQHSTSPSWGLNILFHKGQGPSVNILTISLGSGRASRAPIPLCLGLLQPTREAGNAGLELLFTLKWSMCVCVCFCRIGARHRVCTYLHARIFKYLPCCERAFCYAGIIPHNFVSCWFLPHLYFRWFVSTPR